MEREGMALAAQLAPRNLPPVETWRRDFSKGPVWDERLERYLVEIRYPDGSRVRKRFRREREALRWWTSETARIDSGECERPLPRNITLGHAISEYRRAKQQHRSYKNFIRPLLDFWEQELPKSMRLAQVTPQILERAKMQRASEVSQATANHTLSVLRAVFNWCIRKQLFTSNPVSRVEFFKLRNERVRHLSRKEYDRLLKAAGSCPRYLSPMIELAVHTGLRRSAVLGLRWDECDLDAQVIRKPDSKNAEPATVPMTDRVVQILSELSRRRTDSPYVFCHRKGKHAGEPIRSVKKAFSHALAVAKISDFRWHDLRHCTASFLAAGGADVQTIGRILNHKSLRMTLRYSHLTQEFIAKKIRILDNIPCPKVAFGRRQAPATIGNSRKRRAKAANV